MSFLGLFEPSHMNYALDRAKDGAGEPSLTEMTKKAIDVLSKNNDDNGFFLVVEGMHTLIHNIWYPPPPPPPHTHTYSYTSVY